MSEEQYFEGIKFVAAADAAATFGFTRDYIGILCRSGKVNGRRIGRNWYVDENSLKTFLVNQEHARALRRLNLVAQRTQEYKQAHEPKPTHTSSTAAQAEMPEPKQHKVVAATVAIAAAAAARVPSAADAKVFVARAHEVTQKSAATVIAHGTRAVEKTIGGIKLPVGASVEMMRASVHAGVAHAPVYASTPWSELLHKTFALTLAFVLTFGTYSLVDPTYVRIAYTTARDSVSAISFGAGEVAAFASNPRLPLAFADANPAAAASALADSIPQMAERLARSINSGINNFVFAVAFPGYAYPTAGTPYINRGTVAVQIVPQGRAPRAVTQTTSPATRPVERPVAVQTTPATVINQPIRERVIERERVLVAGGLTEETLTSRLQALEASLSAKMYGLVSANSTPVAQNYGTVIAQTNRIDMLNSVDITDSTFDRGVITNSTINGSTLSNVALTGTTTIGNLSVTGTGTTTFSGGIALTGGCVTVNGVCLGAGGAGNPGGASGQVQFNNGGVFDASASFTFNANTGVVTATGVSTTVATSTNMIAVNATSTNLFSSIARFNSAIIDSLVSTATTITNLIATNSTTTNLNVGGTISGAGLASCSAVGEKLLWNASTRQFQCGVDLDSGSSGFSTTSALYFSSVGLAFSTTSSDYWQTQRNFFSTTSANAWSALGLGHSTSSFAYNLSTYEKGFFFSTTSVNYWESTQNRWATSSADYYSSAGLAFSTTSADYLQSQRNYFSTTSASYFSAIGLAFSTTSTDYWKTQNNFFATTSASFFASNGLAFSTTSSAYFLSQNQGLAFSTTSAAYNLGTYDKGYFFSTTSVAFWDSTQFRWATTSSDAWLATKDKGYFFSTTSASNFLAQNTGNAFSTTSASFFASQGLAFSTTSANFYSSVGLAFSTTSASYFLSLNDSSFSTTSADYYKSQNNFFSTTSASFFSSAGFSFSTTSTDYWRSVSNFFSTTSASHFSSLGLAFSTTSASAFLELNQGAAFSTTSASNFASNGLAFSTTSTDFWLSTKTLSAFSTTSADYWQTQRNFFSTTSANTWSALGFGHSTTSFAYNLSTYSLGSFFSTTSVNFWDSTQARWATTSSEYFLSQNQGLAFSTTSANYYAQASTTIAKTYANNTFTGTNNFQNITATGATTSVLSTGIASTSNLVVSNIQNSLLYTGATGLAAGASITSPLQFSAGTLSIQVANGSQNGYLASADWTSFNSRLSTSTLALVDKGFFFSTTSTDYWKTQNNFFSTTSADAFLSLNQGNAFSTTSAAYNLGTYDKGYFFSTTSVAYWDSTQTRWATTSSDYWLTTKSLSAFSTTSANYWSSLGLAFSTTSANFFSSVGLAFSTTSASYFLSQNDSSFSTTSANYYMQSSSTVATTYKDNTFTGTNGFQNITATGATTTSISSNSASSTFLAVSGTTTLSMLNVNNPVYVNANHELVSAVVGSGLSFSTGAFTLNMNSANTWNALQTFSAGIASYASSTIGNGTQTGGLTVSGGATTTGNTNLLGSLTVTGSTVLGSMMATNATITFASTTALTTSGTAYIGTASTSNLTLSNIQSSLLNTSATGVVQSTTVSSPLLFSAGTLSIQVSNGSQNGYLASADWTSFNSRLSTSTLGLIDKGFFFSTTSALNFSAAGLSFSTTSTDYWKTQNNFFSTSSASFFASQGLAFSTTSSAYFTSAGLSFSTTSNNYWSSVGLGHATTSVAYQLTQVPALTGGFTAYASSTIGNGTQLGGLTISGGATTTGNLAVAGTARISSTFSLGGVLSCSGSQALQTDGSGNVSCGTINTGGNSSAGGWTTNNTGRVTLSTTTDLVVVGASTTPYAKFAVVSGSAATTTLALVAASGQSANVLDVYDASGVLSTTLTAAGNFGLGTSSPFAKLSVVGDAYITGGATSTTFNTNVLGIGGSNYFTSLTGNGLQNSGGVLTVNQGQAFSTTSTDYWKTQNNFFSTTSAAYFSSLGLAFSTTSALAHLTTIDKGFFFSTTSASNFLANNTGAAFSTTSALFFSSVGLSHSTTSVAYQLTQTPMLTNGFTAFASTTIGNGTATGGLTISGDATTTGTAYFAGNVGIASTSPGSRLVVKGAGATLSSSALNVTNSADTSLLFVRNDGNVGFGTTSPSAKLHLWGGASGQTIPNMTTGSLLLENNGSANTSIILQTLTAAGTGMTVTNTGFVGIGTTTPDAALTFGLTSTQGINLSRFDNDAATSYALKVTDENDLTDVFGIYSQGTGLSQVNLFVDGNIGVGSSSPYAKLSVHAMNSETNSVLFAIASSTANSTTTLFTISNTGALTQLGGASSSFSNGFNISTGCFAVNGVCLSSASGFSTTSALYFSSLGLAFSTTSSDYWKTQNNFYSTTSANFWSAAGLGFSTTSSNYWSSAGLGFSTTSAAYYNSQNNFFSTTSALFFSSVGLAHSTTSVAYQLTQTPVMTNGFTAFASSTIGNGTQIGGLTISGGATTTGNAYFAGRVGLGTTSAGASLHIAADDAGDELVIGDDIWEINDAANRIMIGNTDQSAFFRFGQNTTNYGVFGWQYNATPGNSYILLQGNGGNNSVALQRDGGNVGIGTTTPNAKLSIFAAAGETNTALFNIASSTGVATTTLFSISNTGSTTIANGINIAAGCFAVNGTCLTVGAADGTFSTTSASYFSSLGLAFSTTSADYWKTQNNFYSTTSANFWASNGLAFSTTSNNYWSSVGLGFSTTSAAYYNSQNNFFSTTSALFFSSVGLAHSTTSVAYQLTQTPVMSNGFTAFASSTIGNGTQIGGLTISGGATSTGMLYVQSTGTSTIGGMLAIGTTTPTIPASLFISYLNGGTGNGGSSALILETSCGTSAGCFYVNGQQDLNARNIVSGNTFGFTGGNQPGISLAGPNNKTLQIGQFGTAYSHTSGTAVPMQRDVFFTQPTETFTAFANGTNVFTDLATVGIAAPPFTGANGTTTNAYSLLIGSSTASTMLNASTTNSYGLAVFTTGGAQNTYSAIFNGGNVGVGTTSPGTLLALQGVANFSSGTSTFQSEGGINLVAGCYAVNGTCVPLTNDGTFSTTSASYFSSLGLAFSTTSSDYWKTQNNFFSTTSNNYWSSVGLGFSTTSAAYYNSQNNFFSTTSALFFSSVGLAHSTTSVAYQLTQPVILGDATSTSFFTTTASSTNLFSTNGTFGTLNVNGTGNIGGSVLANQTILAGNIGKWVQLDGSGATIKLNLGLRFSTGNADQTADAAFYRLGAGKVAFGSGTVGDTSGTLVLGNIGLGTSSPYAMLSITATSTSGLGAPTTLFAIASTTAGTATTTLFSISNTGSTTIANGVNITSGCFAINGTCLTVGAADGTFSTTSADYWKTQNNFYSTTSANFWASNGLAFSTTSNNYWSSVGLGFSTTSAAYYNSQNNFFSTTSALFFSSVGLAHSTTSVAYQLTQTPVMSNGFTAFASSTIGNGTQIGGLTISGGATTTLNAYFASRIGIGTTSPFASLSIVGATSTTAGQTGTSGLFAIGGTGSTTGAGGAITLVGGRGGTSGAGGAIKLTSGGSGDGANSGANFTADGGGGGIGGSFSITGGDTSSSFGGSITLRTGNALGIAAQAGSLYYFGGTGSSFGGSVFMSGGTGGSAGGGFTYSGGSATSSGGGGGGFTFTGGDATSTGTGGNFTITGGTGGNSLTSTGTGGSVTLNAGAAGLGGGSAGNVILANLRGNVGIGTTTPNAKLTIFANLGDTNTTLFNIGSTTGNATTTLFAVSNTGSTTIANGINITGGCYAVNGACLSAAGFFSTTSASYFSSVGLAFSTTSNDYWKTQNSFFSTTSSNYWSSVGLGFSTTSAAYYNSQNNFFSTTSALFFSSVGLAHSTTSVAYQLTQTPVMSNGFTAFASSTIGNGTRTGGLTISGGATTTGIAYFASNVGVGTTSPFSMLSIIAPTSTVVGQTGTAGLFVLGGTGSTTGDGGAITLNGGIGGTTGTGGAVTFNSGAGDVAAGATLALTGGSGNSGQGGGILLAAGTSSTNGGGSISITGAFNTGQGGGVSIAGGNGQSGGAFSFSGGSAVSNIGTAGHITLTAGTAINNGTAGAVNITSGSGGAGAGDFTFLGGSATESGNGGGFILTGGNATSTGTGGGFSFTGGTGGPSLNSIGNGGSVTLNGGAAGLGGGLVGNIILASARGGVGIGTTSPLSTLAIQKIYGATTTNLFSISSSTNSSGTTNSSIFSVSNTGSTTAANGFNITAGCYAVNGACLTAGAADGTFSTTSANYWASLGLAFSTTSSDFWASTGRAYSTTSANYWSSVGLGFSTTSSTYWSSLGLGHSTTSVAYQLTQPVILGNATSTNFFATTASTTNFFTNTATIGSLTGGAITANTGSITFASTTALTTSGTAYIGTASTSNLTISTIQSALLKTDTTGGVVAAVAGTDYVTPSGLSSAFPFTYSTTFRSTGAQATSTLIGFTGGLYSLASSTIGAGGATTGLTIFGGATSTGNLTVQGSATTTGLNTTVFGLGSNYFTSLVGSGLQNTGGVLTVNTGAAFSTTSTDYWKTQNNFFSTTSSNYWSSAGLGFSTTSAAYYNSQNNFFSTTSALFFSSVGLAHSTTSVAYQLTQTPVMSNGFTAFASSTIGNGTQRGGLTISGGATTTGNASFGGNLYLGGVGLKDAGGGYLSVILSADDTGASLNTASLVTGGIDSNSTGLAVNIAGSGISETAQSAATMVSYGTYTQTASPVGGATGGGFAALDILPVYNQSSGSASNIDLRILRTETALGSGAQNLIQAMVGGALNNWATTTRFVVTNTGAVGVGTSTPGSALSVFKPYGSTNTTLFSIASSTNAGNTTNASFLSVSATGFGTTTLSGLAVSGSATSTSNVGFNITAGCFAINGTCLSTGAGDGTFSTTSASYFSSLGLAFSTTSSDYWKTQNNFYSTTSANYWASQGLAFSTTSSNFWSSVGLGFSTTSANYASSIWAHSSTTLPKTYSANTFSALNIFSTGLISQASTTIGNNTATGGLTILGGATTTGVAYFGSNVGIGTTTPYAKLSVVGDVVADTFYATSTTATSTFNGGVNIGNGAITYDYSSGLTSIQNLALGNMSFDTDAGIVSWTDLPITTAAATGTVESYTAQLDGNPLLTVYGEADGSGGLQRSMVGVGTSTPWARLAVDTSDLASSTFAFVVGSSTRNFLTISNLGNGTTTVSGLAISGSATSTSNVGFNITAGCYAVNGTCLSTGGSGASSTLLANDNTWTGINQFNGGLRSSSTALLSTLSLNGALNFLATSSTSTISTFGGVSFMIASTSGSNFGFGNNALSHTTNGARNVAFGESALLNATTTSDNVALGYAALAGSATNFFGTKNIAIGTQALLSNATGTSNVAVGYQALAVNTNGDYNTGVGSSALRNNTTGSGNAAFGRQALFNTVTGSNNTALGYGATAYNTSATNTTAVGYGAASGIANFNAQGYTVLGANAGVNFANGSDYNTLIGYQAGSQITSGFSNVLVGPSVTAGNLTTGSGNLGFGNELFFPSATANNQLNIGNLIFGTLPATSTSFRLPTSGTIGIGTTSPTSKFGIAANNGDTLTTLFQISSSTANSTTSLFLINNKGEVAIGGATATSSVGQLSVMPGTTTVTKVATGTMNGNGWAIATQGRYIYLAGQSASNGFEVWDVSNPALPVRTGQGTLNAAATGISVQGRYAYVVEGTAANGFEIWDIMNPSAPVRVSQRSLLLASQSIYVQGSYAYIANGSGTTNAFEIWNVANPTAPVRVSANTLNSSTIGNRVVHVQGTYAYFADGSTTNGFEVWDISNPSAPVRTGQGTTNQFARGLAVQGRYAYIAGSAAANGFEVWDIKNPASPTRVGQTNLFANGQRVVAQGRYVYVIGQAATNGFQVIDVSVPTAPVTVSISSNAQTAFGLAVQGRYAFLTENTSTLEIVDLGGAYIQQIETGGIETGTLSVRNGIQAMDASLWGSLSVGQSLNVTNGATFSYASSSVYGTTLPIFSINHSTSTVTTSGTSTGSILTVLANSNIGIGTSSPLATLAIQNNFGSSNANIFQIASSTAESGNTSVNFLSVSSTGFGTTTLSGLNVSGSATSTSNVGFNITSGCFAVNGACVGNAAGGTPTGSDGQLQYKSGSSFAAAGLWSSGVNIGVGSSSPFAKFAINANSGETNSRLFEIASSTGSATTSLFVVNNQGRVGIGAAPSNSGSMLQVLSTNSNGGLTVNSNTTDGNAYFPSFTLNNYDNDNGGYPNFIIANSHGQYQAGTALASGDTLGGFEFQGGIGSNTTSGAATITAVAAENFTGSVNGADLVFSTARIGTNNTVERLRIRDNGTLDLNPYLAQGNNVLFTLGGTSFLRASSTVGNIFLGANAGVNAVSTSSASISSVYNSIAIGLQAMQFATSSAADNVAIGAFALEGSGSDASGRRNVAVGTDALNANRGGFENVAIGWSALPNNTYGADNIAIGMQSGATNATGTESTFVGVQAGFGSTGSQNTCLGVLSCAGAYLAFDATGLTALGHGAGYNLATGANYNTFVGWNAGNTVTAGQSNIYIGPRGSGTTGITTGSRNIVIGDDVGIITPSASNQLNIGNLLFGNNLDGATNEYSTGNIGIGTSSPWAKFTVIASTSNDYRPAFVVATTSNWNASGQQPIIYAFATTTGALDFARVAIGTSTQWGSAGVRDQLTVAGRIYSTWRYASCDFPGMAHIAATAANTGGICGQFTFTITTAGTTVAPSAASGGHNNGALFISPGAGTTAQGPGASIRSNFPFASATTSPVLEVMVQPVLNATNSVMMLVGFNGQYSNTPVVGREPDQFIGFVASSTQTNWFALVRNGTNRLTPIDTGIASSSVVAGTSTPHRMRVEVTPTYTYFLIDGNVVATSTPGASLPSVNLTPHISIACRLGGQCTVANKAKLGFWGLRVWVDDPPGEFASAPAQNDPPSEQLPVEALDWVNGADMSLAYHTANEKTLAGSRGMLLALDSSTSTSVMLSTQPYQQDIVGVQSISARQVLGIEYSTTVRVAVEGRVPVAVTNENGPIKVGDPITAGSIEGHGMKATRPGYVVGRALQDFDPNQGSGSCGYVDITGTTCAGEVLVQLGVAYSLNGEEIAATSTPSSLATALTSLASATTDMIGNISSVVFGQITAKVAIVKDFFADKIFANRVETKELCVEDVCVTKAQFLNMVQAAGAGAATGSNISGNSGGDTAGAGSETATTTPDTEAPVISINGANPALISVGDTYSDLGATALDNATYTLPVTASLDGGEQMDPALIQLDTSAAGEHIITYTSTDAGGNVGTATRTVIVNDPTLVSPPPSTP